MSEPMLSWTSEVVAGSSEVTQDGTGGEELERGQGSIPEELTTLRCTYTHTGLSSEAWLCACSWSSEQAHIPPAVGLEAGVSRGGIEAQDKTKEEALEERLCPQSVERGRASKLIPFVCVRAAEEFGEKDGFWGLGPCLDGLDQPHLGQPALEVRHRGHGKAALELDEEGRVAHQRFNDFDHHGCR
ncbi:hypothetical protein GALMADRAFT_907808 [Galerina marginata CBS 339.88]|uniref:Uncharacterized protein n=1 Tax=Galerina marginata (strain CBS 339.88) TaxID=685588 RepID=A0A067SFT2_GALM3|nr:hypothetical protein GALMADRAFT_907808 [Galerina marginata CBS 339.88]